jgi:hypothetical protein
MREQTARSHIAVATMGIPPYLNDEVDEFVLPHLLQVRVRDEEAHIITLNAKTTSMGKAIKLR